MNNQQHFNRHHQQHQRNSSRQQPQQDRQQPGNPLEQRREFLWRERVKLEMQVQALTLRAEGLAQEWRVLQHRKASMEQQKPKLAVQILLSGLAGTRYLPAERLFQYGHHTDSCVTVRCRDYLPLLACQQVLEKACHRDSADSVWKQRVSSNPSPFPPFFCRRGSACISIPD